MPINYAVDWSQDVNKRSFMIMSISKKGKKTCTH